VVHGPRVVGVILTGELDDGTAGLSAVHRCGGATVVQDPEDAAYPSMPASARAHVAVDHVVRVAEMAALLDRLVREPVESAAWPVPPLAETEAAMTEGQTDDGDLLDRIGERSLLTCPDCRGALWELNDDVLRFRCHVGHAFNAGTLTALQSRSLEDALWAAVRGFGESAYVSEKVARRQPRGEGHAFEARAETARQHAALLRKLIDTLPVLSD
jgi:two-component system chemotaxis response regulator CheB